MEHTKIAYLKYITALLLFGINGIVASYIALNSYEIVFTRTLIGGLMLSLIFIANRRKIHLFEHKKSGLFLLISGMAMGGSWMFLYEAYDQIGVGVATLAYYCGPVIVMVLSPLLFREKLTWPKIFGFLLVFCGMVFVNSGISGGAQSVWGLFCGIMSAVTYAVMVIANKKAKTITGLTNATGQLLVACLTVALFLLWKQGFNLSIERSSILPILILGIVNTGLGCYFYFSSIGALSVQSIAICGYLEPLSAVVCAMLFLHETMSAGQIIGAILILGGAAFGELYRRKTRCVDATYSDLQR